MKVLAGPLPAHQTRPKDCSAQANLATKTPSLSLLLFSSSASNSTSSWSYILTYCISYRELCIMISLHTWRDGLFSFIQAYRHDIIVHSKLHTESSVLNDMHTCILEAGDCSPFFPSISCNLPHYHHHPHPLHNDMHTCYTHLKFLYSEIQSLRTVMIVCINIVYWK